MSAHELPAEVEAEERPHLELVADPAEFEPESAAEAEERAGSRVAQARARVGLLGAELRPYLPTRSALAGPLAGVGAGTAVLLGRGWRWVWAEGLQEAGVRAGGVAIGAYAGAHTLAMVPGPWAGYALPAAVVVWGAVAKRHAPTPARRTEPAVPVGKSALLADDDGQEHVELAPVDEPVDALPEVEAADVVALIRTVAARHGHQGAHLDDLLAEPLLKGWQKSELKTALSTRWSLPVESFKLLFPTPGGRARQRVRDGVRLKHLPAAGEGALSTPAVAPSAAPVEGPVGGAAGARPDPSPTLSADPPQGPG